MTFAEKLKELRGKRNMSRRELAEKSGIARSTVRDYEQGRRKPTLESTIKLATALGTTCNAFAECDDIGGAQAIQKLRRRKR
jgi:transcriptional regulator with XRE-family HTH domain